MLIEFNSDWVSPTVELIKCLRATDEPMINDERGSIDYVSEDKDGKKLIRVLVNEENRMAPAYVDNIRAIIMDLDEKKYDEALILTNRITNSAYELVAERENLEVITPTMKNNFSLKELLSAVQMKSSRICMRKCGKAPESKEDCKGKKGKEYDCEIRRIRDDAKFHATMKWEIVLLEDFNNLCELEKTMLAVN